MEGNNAIWFFEEVSLFEHFCPVNGAEERYGKQPKRQYKKGEFIYFTDDTSDKVFFINSGAVKIGTYTEDGNEVIKAVLHNGEIFGELSVFGEETRGDYAQAMEDTNLCILEGKKVVNLMRDVKGFQAFLNRLMGQRIIYTQKRLEAMLFKDARTRIGEYILEEANKHGRIKNGRVTLKNYLTHQEIANFTGTSRQTVTTILNDFREKGLIDFDRKKIIINDMEQMEEKNF